MNTQILITLFLCLAISACGGSSGGGNKDDGTGGTVTPTPTVAPTQTPEPTITPTPAVTATPAPTQPPVPTATPVPTQTPAPTATPAPTQTPAPTATPAPTQTPEPTATPAPTQTPEPTATPVPTVTPEPTATPAPTATPEPSPAPLSITTENALELSASVMTTVLKSDIPVSTELAGLLTAISSGSEAGIDHSSLLEKVLGSDTSNGLEKTSFPNAPISCSVSGSLTYTGNIASSMTLSAGDQINLEFDQCSNQDGTSTHGTMTYTITTFSGNISLQDSYSLAYQMEFDFEYQDTNQTVVIVGAIATGVSLTNAMHNTGLRAPNLSITVDGNESLISDYVYVQSFDFQTQTLKLVASGTVTSDEIGGSLTFETASALELSPSLDDPISGTFIISDEQGSSVTLNILNDGFAELMIDSDGDGEIDETQQTTWDNVDNFFE